MNEEATMKLGDSVLVLARVFTEYAGRGVWGEPVQRPRWRYRNEPESQNERCLYRRQYDEPQPGIVIGKTHLCMGWKVETANWSDEYIPADFVCRTNILVYEIAFDLRKNSRCYALPEDLVLS